MRQSHPCRRTAVALLNTSQWWGAIRKFMPFPNPKVNARARLKFEFVSNNATVRYVSHYTRETQPLLVKACIKLHTILDELIKKIIAHKNVLDFSSLDFSFHSPRLVALRRQELILPHYFTRTWMITDGFILFLIRLVYFLGL